MPTSPFARTPESLTTGLRRKDSKNALTTCHGVTSAGRACRRPLANAKAAIGTTDFAVKGAFVIPNRNSGTGDPAVFFCWQHKDQAELLIRQDGDEVVDVETGRRSLETVLAELRLEEVAEESEDDSSVSSAASPVRVDTVPRQKLAADVGRDVHRGQGLHSAWRSTDAQSRGVSRVDLAARANYQNQDSHQRTRRQTQPATRHRSRQTRSEGSFWTSLFSCFSGQGVSGIKVDQPPRVRQKHDADTRRGTGRRDQRTPEQMVSHPLNSYAQMEPPERLTQTHARRKSRPDIAAEGRLPQPTVAINPPQTSTQAHQHQRLNPSLPLYRPVAVINPPTKVAHPKTSPKQPQSPRTPDWHPTLPANATDQTRLLYARLLTTMSEPPTKADAPGYIYIFWQTEDQQSEIETAAAQSVISAGDDSASDHASLIRSETILRRRANPTPATSRRKPSRTEHTDRKTLFLKIGRAQNVHQRLTQWQKQCAYDISLLRSYPLQPPRDEARNEANSGAVIKIAYVGKVEKLIHLHLEMLGMRVKKECRCGTVHQEWFEVEASVKRIREVDGVVRDWVSWSEGRFGREV